MEGGDPLDGVGRELVIVPGGDTIIQGPLDGPGRLGALERTIRKSRGNTMRVETREDVRYETAYEIPER